MGRFLSEDPIGFAGGINFYGYVGNNPVLYVDPYGEALTSVDATMYQAIARGKHCGDSDFGRVYRYCAISADAARCTVSHPERKYHGGWSEERSAVSYAPKQVRRRTR